MKCPKCKYDLSIEAKPAHHAAEDVVEVILECQKCGYWAFSFIERELFVEDE